VAIDPGATLTPHFRDFLPGWVGRQPWYEGPAPPVRLALVGAYRLADRDGEVGLETHLVGDGTAVYQVPMSYRGAPPPGTALIATATHSVLGDRWIYDATTDPVWTRELLALVAAGATNREIARHLYLSPKTVEMHLRSAYRKLDLPGRSGLAAALR
jgi:hypothetical protein